MAERVMQLQTMGLLLVDCTIEAETIYAGVAICNGGLREQVNLVDQETQDQYPILSPKFVGSMYGIEVQRVEGCIKD